MSYENKKKNKNKDLQKTFKDKQTKNTKKYERLNKQEILKMTLEIM